MLRLLLNGVNVSCTVQDLHSLKFDAAFFDLAYGSAVLHHLDVDRACREFVRVLKKEGEALFEEEPVFKNPILKLAYETAFGKGRIGRRRKFLFLTRTGTDNEKPLDVEEFEIIRKYFPSFRITPANFLFFAKISQVTAGRFAGVTAILDAVLLRLFPSMREWSYNYNIYMPKNADAK